MNVFWAMWWPGIFIVYPFLGRVWCAVEAGGPWFLTALFAAILVWEQGGPAAPPDGQDTTGCPLYSHPAQLQDNKNCTLCMTCLKACPHKSVQLSHILASLAVLAAPGLLAVAADAGGRLALSRLQQRAPAPLKHLGYGYLPLVWAATLAHYEKPLLSEAGRVLQVAGAMVGWSASSDLPYLAAHPAVIAFIQGSTLLLGTAAALALTRKLGGVPWRCCCLSISIVTPSHLHCQQAAVRGRLVDEDGCVDPTHTQPTKAISSCQ
ncbi:uncharacterized protein HaLaN_05314, partial [Haematococcus lacustris]